MRSGYTTITLSVEDCCHESTSATKPNIHGLKFLLCICWDQLLVVEIDRNPHGRPLSATIYTFEPNIEKKAAIRAETRQSDFAT